MGATAKLTLTNSAWQNVTNGSSSAIVQGPAESFRFYIGPTAPDANSPSFIATPDDNAVTSTLTVTNLAAGHSVWIKAAMAQSPATIDVVAQA